MTKLVRRAITARSKTNPMNITALKEDGVKVGRDGKEALEVFIAYRAATCEGCGKQLERKTLTTHVGETGTQCLTCAGLDHLVFLPRARDRALTRRARKHSTLSVVVLKWRPRRKQYQRCGVLVEAQGLEKARAECLADEAIRASQREQAFERRVALALQWQDRLAARIRTLFPGCPSTRVQEIAATASFRYSHRLRGAVSPSAVEAEVVRLAVMEDIRQREPKYIDLIVRGYQRAEACAAAEEVVRRVLQQWEHGGD